MDTKTMLMIIVRAILMAGGGFLAAHGVMQGSQVETIASAAPVIASLGLSTWDKWGRPLLEAKLEIYKLQAEARKDALVKANVRVPPTPSPSTVVANTSTAVTEAVAVKAVAAVGNETLNRRV